MDFSSVITFIVNLVLVVLLFNVMIFVHELGHFWAGRWRGMYVDRFQIWFGKPIWKKKIKGVQYGLGWIPAGGFVSLPQMASMEAIEGEVPEEVKNLKPPTPLDKIIVAFAGPLFSMLLALSFGVIVWQVGKPDVIIPPTIGYVEEGSEADKAGLRPGDSILAVNGEPVSEWVGNMQGVVEKIKLTEGDVVRFKVQRGQDVLDIESGFVIDDTRWFERRALPKVGIMNAATPMIDQVFENSPAAAIGLSQGDLIQRVNGERLLHPYTLTALAEKGEPIEIEYLDADSEQVVTATLQPRLPKQGYEKPFHGVKRWNTSASVSEVMIYPTPWAQVGQSLNWMKITLQKLFSSSSKVGVDQLAGPVGILNMIFNLLTQPDGILLVLWFSVLLNVNLAVMNMLPIPVLDGGHIVMATLEWVRGKPMSQRPLEIIQTFFALCLMGFMAYVTVKDVGNWFGPKEEQVEILFEKVD